MKRASPAKQLQSLLFFAHFHFRCLPATCALYILVFFLVSLFACYDCLFLRPCDSDAVCFRTAQHPLPLSLPNGSVGVPTHAPQWLPDSPTCRLAAFVSTPPKRKAACWPACSGTAVRRPHKDAALVGNYSNLWPLGLAAQCAKGRRRHGLTCMYSPGRTLEKVVCSRAPAGQGSGNDKWPSALMSQGSLKQSEVDNLTAWFRGKM